MLYFSCTIFIYIYFILYHGKANWFNNMSQVHTYNTYKNTNMYKFRDKRYQKENV